MPATRKDTTQLRRNVYTRDNGEMGVFGAPMLESTYHQRASFIRSLAEDVEQSTRLAAELRDKQRKQSLADHPHAELRRPERNAEVERLERQTVREAIMLFAQVVRFTDDGVLDEEMCKVVTPRDLDAMMLALRAFGGENV